MDSKTIFTNVFTLSGQDPSKNRYVEMLGIARIGVAHIQQGLVDGADRADDVFLESARQVLGVVNCRAFGLNALIMRPSSTVPQASFSRTASD